MRKILKTQNKTKWLVPYVQSVKDIIPARRLTLIRGYKVPRGKFAGQYGSCLKDVDGTFVINMRLYRWDEKSKRHVGLYLGHLLETFAHELAHTVPGCWNHTAKHVEYTGLILARFAKVLKKQKIKDTYKTRMHYE